MTDAPVINVAGRQRMLSQRLAKAALALDRARTATDSPATSATSWTRCSGSGPPRTIGLRRWRPRAVAPRPEQRGRSPRRLTSSSRSSLGCATPPSDLIRDDSADGRANLATILDVEAEYLPRMDRIVGLYEREARGHVDRLIWTGWGVTALILLALAAIGRFILRPASRTHRAPGRRAAPRPATRWKARVRERTRELERAQPRPRTRGARTRAGRGAAAHAPRAVQPRRPDDDHRRDGQRPGPRAEPAARGDRQLRRGLPRRARLARPAPRRGPDRAREDPGDDAPRRRRSSSASGGSSPATGSTRERFEPNRLVARGRGVLPRRGPPAAGSTVETGPGTRLAKSLGRPGADPAGAGQPGPQRLRALSRFANP